MAEDRDPDERSLIGDRHATTFEPRLPIAIVAPLYPPAIGGVEQVVEHLAQGLVERGFPVEVVVTDPSSRSVTVELRDGVVIRRFPTLARDSTYFVSPRLARWLYQHARQYELIHLHNYHTMTFPAAGVAAARSRVPIVVSPYFHGTGHTSFRRLLHVAYRPLATRLLRAADAVIAGSHAEQSRLEEAVPGLGVHVVPLGIEIDVGQPAILPDPFARPFRRLVLSVGRLSPYKRVDRIVRAMSFVDPDTALIVIGDGPAAQDIRLEVQRLGLGDRVSMLGRVSDAELSGWYRRADAFVTLSAEESFGLTVLEAASCGAPVVASDIPAHREVSGYVSDGRVTLVDPGAADQAVAMAIEGALELGRLGGAAVDAIPTWHDYVEAVIRIYAKAVTNRRSSARG